jgi:leucyl-tRNA synthetase
MWEKLGHKPAIANAGWPAVDPALLEDDAVEVVLQINGKIIDRLDVSPSISKENLEIAARANEKVAAALAGVEVKKAIVVPPKLVNFVI